MIRSSMKCVLAVLTYGFLAAINQPSYAGGAPEPLTMTYIRSNADYWDVDVAEAKGFFADEGFAPEYVSNSGSVQSTQLLLTNSVQLAITQPEALIAAIARGSKNLAGIAAPMERVDWMLVGQKGLNIQDLKGKTIGFSGLRVTEFWLTQRALQESGLDPKSYDSIQIGTTPAKYSALTNGSVAAVLLFQPTASQAVHAGYSRLFDLGKYDRYIPGIYMVNRVWAAQNDHGVRLARALQRAHEWLYDPKNREEAIAILKKLSKSSDAALAEVYDIFFVNEKSYTPEGQVDVNSINQAIQTLVDHSELDSSKAPTLDQILLPAALGGLRK
ncbi:ABC transporter substrate-binding protein [Phyllobacterium sp. SB3]|uniref:ABC transporter substrate-binding protein n=1 Tax=Phyllobacterium sp. SB3 TaxID=3156073 RepID=UPI0032AFB4C4